MAKKHLIDYFYIGFGLLALAYSVYIGIRYPVTLFSDFAYYWKTSYEISNYVKGGFFIALISIVRFFFASPHLVAIIINSIGLILIWSAGFFLKNRFDKFLYLIFFVLLSYVLSGFFSFLNSDIIHLGLGVASLLLVAFNKRITAILLLFLALGIRLQSYLAMIVFGFFVGFEKKWRIWFGYILILGVFLFLFETTLSSFNHSKVAVNNAKRVPLYAGLIASNPLDVTCGEWSIEAGRIASKESEKKLALIFLDYFKKNGFPHLINTMSCKLNKMLKYESVSYYWLMYAVNNNYTHTEISESELIFLQKMTDIELVVFKLLKIYVLILLLIQFLRKKYVQVYFGLLVLISYTLVHLVFEIQSRYMLEPIVFSVVVLLFSWLNNEKNNHHPSGL